MEGVQSLPISLSRGTGERGIDHEPDSELIVACDEISVCGSPILHLVLHQLSQNKGEQDLVTDGEYCSYPYVCAAGIVYGEEDADEQRRQEDAQQAGHRS